MAEQGLLTKIKELLSKKGSYRLIIIFLTGVILISIGNLIGVEDTKEDSVKSQTNQQKADSHQLNNESLMEQKLAEILSNLSGVGEVKVDITLDSGTEYKYVRDVDTSSKNTQEHEGREAHQKSKREEVVVIRNQSGAEEAVVKQEIKPRIRGVVVVAQGAEVSQIKANLVAAVKVGLGVETHKIVILPMKR
ncbi:MAG: hypothetical protein ACQEQI_04695 [Bacillota bacterium]